MNWNKPTNDAISTESGAAAIDCVTNTTGHAMESSKATIGPEHGAPDWSRT